MTIWSLATLFHFIQDPSSFCLKVWPFLPYYMLGCVWLYIITQGSASKERGSERQDGSL